VRRCFAGPSGAAALPRTLHHRGMIATERRLVRAGQIGRIRGGHELDRSRAPRPGEGAWDNRRCDRSHRSRDIGRVRDRRRRVMSRRRATHGSGTHVGLTNCPFTSGLPRFAPLGSAGWIQACLGPDLGCMPIPHQGFIINITKSTTAPCDHRGIRCSSLTCFASGAGRAAAGSYHSAIWLRQSPRGPPGLLSM
jgi:hypothetical protein